MPIFTFVNKCDRAGEDPLEADRATSRPTWGSRATPMTWPITADGTFVGVYDRRRAAGPPVRARHRARRAARPWRTWRALDDPDDPRRAWARRRCEQLAARPGSCSTRRATRSTRRRCAAGELTPVFFGSALTNFGVEPFLQRRSSSSRRRRARATGRRRHLVEPIDDALHRLRVQDPGEHGPEAPRPHRVPPRLLGAVRRRACEVTHGAHRQAHPPGGAAAVPGAGARGGGGGVAGRRGRASSTAARCASATR